MAKKAKDFIQFEPADVLNETHSEGLFGYDSTNKSLVVHNDISDVRLTIGEENFVRVINNTGQLIETGSAVRLAGSSVSNIPEIELASADAIEKADMIGLTTHDIPDGAQGFVTTSGAVRGVDTSQWSEGTRLFLSESPPGSLVAKAPVLKVVVGIVRRSDPVEGIILVIDEFIKVRDNRIVVLSKTDFPEPVSGTIQLQGGVTYEIIGDVNLGFHKLSVGPSTEIRGINRFQDRLIYSGTESVIESRDNSFIVNTLEFKSPNAPVYDIANTAGNEKTSQCLIESCTYDNVDSIAKIENWRTYGEENAIIFSTNNGGYLISGSQNGEFLIFDLFIEDFNGTLFDFTSSVSDLVHIDRSDIVLNPGTTGLSGLSSSGNISVSGSGRVTSNNFVVNGGTPLNGIQKSDVRWSFQINSNIADSTATGVLKWFENTTATVINTTGVYEKVAGTTIPTELELFDSSVNNRLTYVGQETINAKVSVTGNLAGTGGGSDIFNVTIFKNGSQISNLKVAITAGATARPFSLNDIVSLSNGDFIELYIKNNSDTSDVIIQNAQLTISK